MPNPKNTSALATDASVPEPDFPVALTVESGYIEDLHRKLKLALDARAADKRGSIEPLYSKRERWALIEDAFALLDKTVQSIKDARRRFVAEGALGCGEPDCEACNSTREDHKAAQEPAQEPAQGSVPAGVTKH